MLLYEDSDSRKFKLIHVACHMSKMVLLSSASVLLLLFILDADNVVIVAAVALRGQVFYHHPSECLYSVFLFHFLLFISSCGRENKLFQLQSSQTSIYKFTHLCTCLLFAHKPTYTHAVTCKETNKEHIPDSQPIFLKHNRNCQIAVAKLCDLPNYE